MRTISVSSEVLSAFPESRIGVLILSGLKNSVSCEALTDLLRSEEKRQKEVLAAQELPSLPELKAWRDAYRKFGSDPRDFRPSVESLLRRARGGSKPLPLINPLVDLYNYISIKYHVPVGAEDLQKIKGDIRLVISKGEEAGVTLGSSDPEQCYPGEVIYRDDESFLCRRWNWREADRTKIEPGTTHAVLVIDTVGGIGAEVLSQALDETQTLVARELEATIVRSVLDSSNPQFEFAN